MTKNMAGQLLMCGFDGYEPTRGILELIRDHQLGSIILFSRNIKTPEQVQRLTHALQTAAKESGHERPLWIAVDQENGVVRRLGTSATYLPGSMALGAIDSTNEAFEVAKCTAVELLSLGIQWNLAPVLDVNNNPLNPVIGVRSFGEDPEGSVARLGKAQVDGYQTHGVAACVKHFPGHGDTATDSHLGVPVIDKEIQTELLPFRQAFAAQGHAYPASVMIAHISLPRIIKDSQVASLSPEVVRGLLRQDLGYKGVVITDCLEMDAVKETVGSARGAVMALEAGNDIAMICHTLEHQKQAIELIEKMDQAQLQHSLDRVAAMKDSYLSWEDALDMKDLKTFGSHQKTSERLYDKVPTIVRNIQGLVPFKPSTTDKILFLATHVPLTLAIDSEPEPFNSLNASLSRRHAIEYCIFDANTDPKSLLSRIQAADYVIVGTANANLYPFQSEMVQYVHTHASRLIVAAVINPYDIMVFPQIQTYLVTYEYTPPAHEALVRILFGEIPYRPNRLPITLPQPVERFEVEIDLEEVHGLWCAVFGPKWPLEIERMKRVLSAFQGWVVRDGKRIVGFAATKPRELALMMVHPKYRRRGIGSHLHTYVQTVLEDEYMLGATYPRFFCGVPQTEEAEFFKKRGYIFGNIVWDLMGDLTGYKIPKDVQENMANQGIVFETIEKERENELIEFEKKYFECWVETYAHHCRLGDHKDLLVARNKQQEIVASLVLYTASKGSHEARTDLIWTHSDLFGPKSGSMACVGVADNVRGKGIGLAIVAHANKILCERGVNKSCVDWVELVDFYGRTGYQRWRGYSLVKKIK